MTDAARIFGLVLQEPCLDGAIDEWKRGQVAGLFCCLFYISLTACLWLQENILSFGVLSTVKLTLKLCANTTAACRCPEWYDRCPEDLCEECNTVS